MALRVFTSARAALEATPGVDLTPTRILYAEEFTHEQDKATIRPSTLNATYEGHREASPGVETNTLTMAGRASYQDLVWLGNIYIAPLLTGVGGPPTYTYALVPALSSDNRKTATIQLGYADTIATTPGVKLNYCKGNTLNLHFEKSDDGAVTFNANFFVGSAAAQITAFTGSLSDRTVRYISSNNTTITVDTTTIGTTPDLNITALDWTLDLSPVAFHALDGTTAPNAIYSPNHRIWTATITRRYNAATEWSAYTAKTVRKIRVTTAESFGGVSYSAILDLYGVYTGRTWSEIDGIITEELTLENLYDTTALRSHSLTVASSEATVS